MNTKNYSRSVSLNLMQEPKRQANPNWHGLLSPPGSAIRSTKPPFNQQQEPKMWSPFGVETNSQFVLSVLVVENKAITYFISSRSASSGMSRNTTTEISITSLLLVPYELIHPLVKLRGYVKKRQFTTHADMKKGADRELTKFGVETKKS